MTRARSLLVAATLAGASLAVAPAAAMAAEADFGQPTATATWGEGIEFTQPVTLSGEIRRVEVLIEAPGALGPVVSEVVAREGEQTLRHEFLIADGHLLPNTTLTASWRVVGEDGGETIGPPTTVTYADNRFEWRVREGQLVRVHWYEGGDGFGDRALEIGERAIRETSELLGVTEEAPVDFFVYADQAQFYQALGPGTRENVGGQANAELRTLFALITPEEIDDAWVGVVIPHELVHLVFDTAVDNPYHFPPRWLNEGIAVYLSQGYELGDRSAVEQAAQDGSLIPLEGLSGQFPTTRERFFLAYAESVAAVDFLIAEHGRDALVSLVRSYATGLTDDEAFTQAIGLDLAAFDAAWRDSLGAGDPVEHGPHEAPAGPLPPGWTAEGSPGSTLPPGSRPTAGPAAPTSPDVVIEGPDNGVLIAVGAVLAVVVAALGFYVLVLHRRPPKLPAMEGADAGGAIWSSSAYGAGEAGDVHHADDDVQAPESEHEDQQTRDEHPDDAHDANDVYDRDRSPDAAKPADGNDLDGEHPEAPPPTPSPAP
jgi:hypothetical protein